MRKESPLPAAYPDVLRTGPSIRRRGASTRGMRKESPLPAAYPDMLRTGPSIRRRGASTRGMRKESPLPAAYPDVLRAAPRYDAGARLLGVYRRKALTSRISRYAQDRPLDTTPGRAYSGYAEEKPSTSRISRYAQGKPLDATPGRVYSGYTEEKPSTSRISRYAQGKPLDATPGRVYSGYTEAKPSTSRMSRYAQGRRFDTTPGASTRGMRKESSPLAAYPDMLRAGASIRRRGRLLGVYRSKALYQPYVPICSGQALRYDAGGVYSGYAEGKLSTSCISRYAQGRRFDTTPGASTRGMRKESSPLAAYPDMLRAGASIRRRGRLLGVCGSKALHQPYIPSSPDAASGLLKGPSRNDLEFAPPQIDGLERRPYNCVAPRRRIATSPGW